MTLARASHEVRSARAFRDGAWSQTTRAVAAETPIAIVVDGAAEAVMMASPSDLEDFALGFALTEGIIRSPGQIRELELADTDLGPELRLWLRDSARSEHAARKRTRAGPAGCGLCGIESLEQAMRPLPSIQARLTMSAADIVAAMRALPEHQVINTATRAAHAAAFYSPTTGIALVREDVGRHSALDKLVGALSRTGADASTGAILMTSRVSIELIQKAAFIGAPILAAISAPSMLALDAAQTCGLCVCGIVRDNGLEVFTHPERIT